MTFEELNKIPRCQKEEKKKSRHHESQIQQNCVWWFRLQYPAFKSMLFAVPNGGARSPVEAKIMKAEGVTPGVSDLILLVSRKGYNALCLECKTAAGRQSHSQAAWQADCEAFGNKYVIFRSVDEFINIINDYLK
jgi:hypothetical protein